MKTNPFKDYKPEEAAIFLEQSLTPDGAMIRCQLEGKGSDIVHMLSMALAADAKEGGVLRQMIADALAIGVDVDASEMKIRMQSLAGNKKVIN